jgi:hypothetical protein
MAVPRAAKASPRSTVPSASTKRAGALLKGLMQVK